jgi:Mn2+/Fe2+ NRAMP family transporter
VLVVAAVVLGSNGIHVDSYQSAVRTLTDPFGDVGYYLFAASLFIACFGSALEVNLDSAYAVAQGFGWNWGESVKPIKAARFSAVYSLFVIPPTLLILLGVDPMKLTMYSMAIATLILPLVVLPFLVLMNDPKFVGENRNGPVGNTAVFAIIVLTFLLAVVAIPLQLMGGD